MRPTSIIRAIQATASSFDLLETLIGLIRQLMIKVGNSFAMRGKISEWVWSLRVCGIVELELHPRRPTEEGIWESNGSERREREGNLPFPDPHRCKDKILISASSLIKRFLAGLERKTPHALGPSRDLSGQISQRERENEEDRLLRLHNPKDREKIVVLFNISNFLGFPFSL